MKIKILLCLLMLSIFYPAFSQNISSLALMKNANARSFKKLIIKCDAKVVLYENDMIDTIRIEGSERLIENVFVLQNGDELIVNAKTKKDLKQEGTVYIPVNALQYMEINADAKVISYSTLRSPELNILVNGNCIISIVLKGKLNIQEAEGYNWSFRRVAENANTPTYLNKNLNH